MTDLIISSAMAIAMDVDMIMIDDALELDLSGQSTTTTTTTIINITNPEDAMDAPGMLGPLSSTGTPKNA